MSKKHKWRRPLCYNRAWRTKRPRLTLLILAVCFLILKSGRNLAKVDMAISAARGASNALFSSCKRASKFQNVPHEEEAQKGEKQDIFLLKKPVEILARANNHRALSSLKLDLNGAKESYREFTLYFTYARHIYISFILSQLCVSHHMHNVREEDGAIMSSKDVPKM